MRKPRFDNRVGTTRVSIRDLAAEIHQVGRYLTDTFDPSDLQDTPDDTPGTDCRLQVHEGSWAFHTGDSGYDTDHHGYWGSSCIPARVSKAEARRIAEDLIDQAADMAAQEGE